MSEIEVKQRKLKAESDPITEDHKFNCIKVAKNYIPGWTKITDENQISLKPITGGLTNVLTKVTIPQSLANELGIIQQALIRHFGKDTELFFFERQNEELIFKSCASVKLSPDYIASFPGGRIEEFLEAYTLNTSDCKSFINEIAMKTAEIHNHQIDEIPKEPSIFNTLTSWLKCASEVVISHERSNTKALGKIDFAVLKSEIEFLKKIIIPLNSPVVFSHNDLLSGNFMYNPQTKRFYVIDFEYANYNYRGFDLGNHFSEWAVDYSRPDYPKFYFLPQNYPTASEREAYIKSYLIRSKELKGENLTIHEYEIAQIDKELDFFLLLPHFAWSTWAIVQAATSEIQFGYMEFSQARRDHYFDLKRDLIKKYKLEEK